MSLSLYLTVLNEKLRKNCNKTVQTRVELYLFLFFFNKNFENYLFVHHNK